MIKYKYIIILIEKFEKERYYIKWKNKTSMKLIMGKKMMDGVVMISLKTMII